MAPFTFIEVEAGFVLIVTSDFVPGKICCLDKEGKEVLLDPDTKVTILHEPDDHFVADMALKGFMHFYYS